MTKALIKKNRFDNLKHKLKEVWQKPELLFVWLASFFGLGMLVTLQLFMAPDESAHFYRAYQVSQGHLISESKDGRTGGEVPEKIVGYITHDFSTSVRLGGDPPKPRWQYFTEKVDSPVVFTDFRSSALYSPVSYIPQALGIGIGKAIYPSIGSMMFMGRLFNLAAFIVLIYIAIRIATQGKWVYVVAGLFPMAIQQASSLSSDVMTIGLAFVFIALVHRCFTQKKHLERWQYVLFVLLAVGLALTKQTNIILLFPVLFIPRRLFGSVWKKLGFIGLVGAAGLIAMVAWYMILKFGRYEMLISGEPGVNASGQLHFLLGQPLEFFEILFRTYIYEGFHGMISTDFYWTSAYGIFSWITYKLPLSLIIMGYMLLALALLYRGAEKDTPKNLIPLTFVQLGTIFLSFIAIAAALYLTWTPVGRDQAWGIQGRYFIVLIPLLIPLFALLSHWIKVSFDKPYRMGMLVTVVSFINLTTMLALTYKWFY